ncbi:MAG: hypothetical protein ACYDAE_28980, partial [Steroidobacteraceae bacterium]
SNSDLAPHAPRPASSATLGPIVYSVDNPPNTQEVGTDKSPWDRPHWLDWQPVRKLRNTSLLGLPIQRAERNWINGVNAYEAAKQAPQDNSELSAAYRRHRVTLAGVAVGRLFLSEEQPTLERHLRRLLRPTAGRPPFQVQDGVATFFSRAEQNPGESGYWFRLGSLSRPDGPSSLESQYRGLPTEVDVATLYLGCPQPGFAFLSAVFAMKEGDSEVITEVLHAEHPCAVRRQFGYDIRYTVAASKSEAIAAKLSVLESCGIFPKHIGVPRRGGYRPCTLALYNVHDTAVPLLNDRDWLSLCQVLGIPFTGVGWGDPETVLLLRGLPRAVQDLDVGWSAFMPTAAVPASDVQSYVSMNNWLLRNPWDQFLPITASFAADEAIRELGAEMTRLRATLERPSRSPIRRMTSQRFGLIVKAISMYSDQIQRLDSFTSPGMRTGWSELKPIPPFDRTVRSEAQGSKPLWTRIRAMFQPSVRPSGNRHAQGTDTPPRTIAVALHDMIDTHLADARRAAVACRERAEFLAAVRNSSSLRVWTIASVLIALSILGLSIASHH